MECRTPNNTYEAGKENTSEFTNKKTNGGNKVRPQSCAKNCTSRAQHRPSFESRAPYRCDSKKSGQGYEHSTMSDEVLSLFRTKLCRAHQSHQCKNADKCPHSHCLTWQRRDPSVSWYSHKLCPEIEFSKKGTKMTLIRRCTKGRSCTYAHSKEEELYHPQMYKTKMCSAYPNCSRYFCPFAHSNAELRLPETDMFNSPRKSHLRAADATKDEAMTEIKLITPKATPVRKQKQFEQNVVSVEPMVKPMKSTKKPSRLRPPSAATTACCSQNVSPLITWSPLVTEFDFRPSPMPELHLGGTPIESPTEENLRRAVDILESMAQLDIAEANMRNCNMNSTAELPLFLSDERQRDEDYARNIAEPELCIPNYGAPGLCRQTQPEKIFTWPMSQVEQCGGGRQSPKNEPWLTQYVKQQQLQNTLLQYNRLDNGYLSGNFEDIDYEEIWNDITSALIATL